MKKKTVRTVVCLLLAATVLTAFAALAGGVGSQDDPLVTLSYLNGTFLDQVLEKVDKSLESRGAQLQKELEQEIAQREQALRGQLSGAPSSAPGGDAAAYTALVLSAGQTLSGGAGCEVLLRSGGAVCVADSASAPALVDTTSGESVNGGGSLQINHLYLMPAAAGIRASGAATVLVRGSYTVG